VSKEGKMPSTNEFAIGSAISRERRDMERKSKRSFKNEENFHPWILMTLITEDCGT
jgi:hypothetical protein